jgi:hypothetical protein
MEFRNQNVWSWANTIWEHCTTTCAIFVLPLRCERYIVLYHNLLNNTILLRQSLNRLVIKGPIELVSRFRVSEQRNSPLYLFRDLFGSDGII